MNIMKHTIMALAVVILMAIGAMATQATPMSGDFDISIDPPGVSFDPVPWEGVPGEGSKILYVFPYATTDYENIVSGSGAGALATVAVSDSGVNVSDGWPHVGPVDTGDLAVRFDNKAGQTISTTPTTMTLDCDVQGIINVYLPEVTFDAMDEIFFWVADSGATYYANTSMGPGAPDLSAADAIGAGDTYLAGDPPAPVHVPIPEPAGLSLLGMALLGLKRKRRS